MEQLSSDVVLVAVCESVCEMLQMRAKHDTNRR